MTNKQFDRLKKYFSASNRQDFNKNIIKYLDFLKEKNNFKEEPSNSNVNTNVYNIDYYFSNDFFDEILKNNGEKLKYYASSLNSNDKGLEFSQLRTFLFTKENFDNKNNKFIPINGGPGTGKSTTINYIISNYLFDTFLRDVNRNGFKFKELSLPPKILITGQTKISVKNVVDICEINFKNRLTKIQNHNKDNISQNKIDFHFNSINIHTRNDDEYWKEEYYKKQLNKNELEIIKENFLLNCKENWFSNENVNENNLIFKLWNKIKQNIEEINKQIECVANIWNRKEKLTEYIENSFIYFYLQNNFSLITNYKIYNKKEYFKALTHFQQELIDNHKNVYCNDHSLFKSMDFLISNYKNKYKVFFSSKKRISKRFKKIIIEWNNFWKRDLIEEIEKLNKYFILANNKVLKNFNENDFKNQNELLNLLFDFIENINSESLKEGIIKIQKNLDETLRHENVVLYRTIYEWHNIQFLLNNLSKNEQYIKKYRKSYEIDEVSGFNNLKYIKPVISCNIQGINSFDVNNIHYDKAGGYVNFDLIIIDEAGQIREEYFYFLNELTNKKIIAFGDELQLEPIKDENEENIISTLGVMNNLSNIKSYFNIYNKNEIPQKGLWLLEHFRCPEEIFKIINKYFYNNKLIYKKILNLNDCGVASFLGNKLSCSQNSYIQISYNNCENINFKSKLKNSNFTEIIIGLKYIVENLDNFYSHCDNNEMSKYEYLEKNVAFIVPYVNQKKLFEDIVNNLQSNLKEIIFKSISNEQEILKIQNLFKTIRCGTIDSLQGIGCDFILYSNVSQSFLKEWKSLNDLKKEEIDKNEVRTFEFNKNRVNVLLSRTKQHFIEIINQNYWQGFEENKDKLGEFEWSFNIKEKIDKNEDKTIIKLNIDTNNNFKWEVNEIKNKENLTWKVGKKGENIFAWLWKNKEIIDLLKLKVKTQLNKDIYHINKLIHLNEQNETYKPYDFMSDDQNVFIELKSTTKVKDEKIHLSEGQIEFNQNSFTRNYIYLVATISNVNNINTSIFNWECLSYALSKVKFYLLSNNKSLINDFVMYKPKIEIRKQNGDESS